MLGSSGHALAIGSFLSSQGPSGAGGRFSDAGDPAEIGAAASAPVIPYRSRPSYALMVCADWCRIDREVQRWDLRAGLATRFDVDLGLSYAHLRERLPSGRSDHLWLVGSDVGWRLVTTHQVMVRIGGGIDVLGGGERSHAGRHGSLALDVFPLRPLVLRSELRAGEIGDAVVIQARVTGGVAWRAGEIGGGYQWLRIGDVPLDGPVMGVAWTF